jgi:hypothetical protein
MASRFLRCAAAWVMRPASPEGGATMDATMSRHAMLEELERTAEEIRVRMHLASMDAKDTWSKTLEPKVFEVREALRHAKDTSLDAARDLAEKLKTFRASL